MASNKGMRFPCEALARSEVEAILRACPDTFCGRRLAATVALMWRTGARCNEALGLRRADVDLAQGVVRILNPKGARRGKKPRVVGLDGLLVPWLERWLAVRPAQPLGWFFCSRAGTRVATSRVRESLPRVCVAGGLRGRRVSPHMLRHTFAFECAMEGRPLPWIRRALGHSSLQTTERYLDHLAPADVVAGMKERA